MSNTPAADRTSESVPGEPVHPESSGNEAIEIRVERLEQLFDMLDPFPFRKRSLDKSAEDYIVGWARELPRNLPLRIIVHAPGDDLGPEQGTDLEGALRNFFDYRAQLCSGDIRELFRIGRRSLAIGIVVLVFCLSTAELLAGRAPLWPIEGILHQSLLILGWVANWRPLEIFLYDWWPLVRHRDLYRRLALARVSLQVY